MFGLAVPEPTTSTSTTSVIESTTGLLLVILLTGKYVRQHDVKYKLYSAAQLVSLEQLQFELKLSVVSTPIVCVD